MNDSIPFRIGHGYDAHRFTEGRRLVLGGVDIACDKGMLAHSDGDVVLHALCDALLGAAAMGDIGQHFPDSDKKFANIDSRILLRDIVAKLHGQHYTVANVDVTIIAQAPKLAPHIAGMIINIAADLKISASQVNVKATTTEKMGFTGREEGIACHAVVLIVQHSNT